MRNGMACPRTGKVCRSWRVDTANVLWTQPEDNAIFATFRDDVPASGSLFGARPAHKESVAAGLSLGAPHKVAGHSASAAAASAAAASAAASSASAAGKAATPGATPVDIRARTANQSICAG